jgi:quinate dehydrogenase (quinone)
VIVTSTPSRHADPAHSWRWAYRVVAALCAVFALAFVVGGAYLARLGGSWYFAIAGIVMLAAAVELWRGRARGAWLYAGVLAGSAAWAVWEAGWQFWPLISRLFALGVLGLLVALVVPLLPGPTRARRRGGWGVAALLGVALAASFAGMFTPHAPVVAHGTGPGPGLSPVDPAHMQKDWAHYGNTSSGSRFAALDQIRHDNVKDLWVAWSYRTGDVAQSDGNGAEDQTTPLQIGERVYLCTPHNDLIALDAESGAEVWKRPINAKSSVWQRCRGLAYFDAAAPLEQSGSPGAAAVTPVTVAPGANCQRRLLTNTIDARLIAVDADTGAFCQGFGRNGQVDLKAGLGAAPDPFYQLTSPPLMAGTTVVVGGRVADNVQADMPGGVIRGFDVVTGAMRWAFDPGNPQDKVAPEPGKTYARSTPNVWAPMSYDPALNTVFLPMGSPSTDIYASSAPRSTTPTARPSSRSTRPRARRNGSTRPCTTTSGTSTCQCSRAWWTYSPYPAGRRAD